MGVVLGCMAIFLIMAIYTCKPRRRSAENINSRNHHSTTTTAPATVLIQISSQSCRECTRMSYDDLNKLPCFDHKAEEDHNNSSTTTMECAVCLESFKTKADYDKECNICRSPFTVCGWRPGRNAGYKKTEICQTRISMFAVNVQWDLSGLIVYRHEMSGTGELSQQNIKYSYYGRMTAQGNQSQAVVDFTSAIAAP
ncbi:hypothetical protein ACH5RR_001877 [Cinchona calisaya]|uniref:Uncharacterized protein n=1 Tax=Cinchona calisaya TaxID=153742 RepID=A0ABD3B536_9GENT